MIDAILVFLNVFAPTLTRLAGILVVVATLPLIVLAWGRKIYPTLPLTLAMLVPFILSLLLLIDSQLLVLVLIIDVIVFTVGLADLMTLPGNHWFSARREMQRVASLGKHQPVVLQIDNRSNRTIRVKLKDDYPQEFQAEPEDFTLTLAPRSESATHYELRPNRRGAFTFDNLYLHVHSRLGLWQKLITIPAPATLHVYPDMKQLGEYAILARTNRLSLMGVRRTRKIGTDNDFERLRDYTPDDNYKYLDWRASARRSKLTVKDFQTSQSQRIIFLVDCGRMMTNEAAGLSLLDHALNSMLMLSYVALKQGDSVGMIAFADEILSYVPPQGGMNQMNRLLHASFDRFPRLVESRYDEAFLYLNTHCRKRSLVVLISNLIDEVNSLAVQNYLTNLVGRHLPLGVLLRDHRLFDVADRQPQDDEQLFQAAAAAEILSWRHQVLRDLEHKGVLALDVYPEDMTAPLVNTYLEAKARHLL